MPRRPALCLPSRIFPNFVVVFDYRTIVRIPNLWRRYGRPPWLARAELTSDGHGGDLAGEAVELGEKMFAHVVAGRSRRVCRQIDGAEGLSAAIQHRHGQRAQSTLEFFV